MMGAQKVVLEGNNINKIFGYGKTRVHAVKNVDFKFHQREIISIVGESGSGKTTLAKMIMGLTKENKGEFSYNGKSRDLSSFRKRKAYYKEVQAVFQDPYAAFNQFYKVETLLWHCLKLKDIKVSKDEAYKLMAEACSFVNLKFDELYNKYPFELSGGQMQRIMIARIFLLQPRVLIADEPTSMVDACSRVIILDMLVKLKDKNNMTIAFITHDLGLAYYLSDTICIMNEGEIVERGSAESIILQPKNSYTQQLLSDVPKLKEPWSLD